MYKHIYICMYIYIYIEREAVLFLRCCLGMAEHNPLGAPSKEHMLQRHDGEHCVPEAGQCRLCGTDQLSRETVAPVVADAKVEDLARSLIHDRTAASPRHVQGCTESGAACHPGQHHFLITLRVQQPGAQPLGKHMLPRKKPVPRRRLQPEPTSLSQWLGRHGLGAPPLLGKADTQNCLHSAVSRQTCSTCFWTHALSKAVPAACKCKPSDLSFAITNAG